MRRHDNFSTYEGLRKDFPWFSYDSFRYYFTGKTMEIDYFFSLSGKIFFTPHISIPIKNNIFKATDSLSAPALDNLVFNAGMIELISYWKAACPPQLIIKPFRMNSDQIAFWKKIYFQGLGEFFYLNSIPADYKDFMSITCDSAIHTECFDFKQTQQSIVPVGGGKDSAVTAGLLNQAGEDWAPFVINPGKTTLSVLEAAGKKESETIELYRSIDPELLRLNKRGFLNGHTPFSAMLAFYSLLVSYLTGRTDIILSNESSANEATVPGTSINHQYSKTIEFEADFRNYSREFISAGFNYFSMLRPISEFRIAEIFAGMPQFHEYFRSCNVGSKTGAWCGKCPKCLFTFIILSPFLNPDHLVGIFGKNLLDDPDLEGIFYELNGSSEIKPFECIGTVDEVNHALDLAIARYPEGKLPFLLGLHEKRRKNTAMDWPVILADDYSTGKHFVPEKYLLLLRKKL